MDPRNEYSLADYMKMMMLEQEKQLEALVERMEPERRAKLMALTNCHSRDGNGILNGIIQTNGYGIYNLVDKDNKPEEDDLSNPFFTARFVMLVRGSIIGMLSCFFLARVAITD